MSDAISRLREQRTELLRQRAELLEQRDRLLGFGRAALPVLRWVHETFMGTQGDAAGEALALLEDWPSCPLLDDPE